MSFTIESVLDSGGGIIDLGYLGSTRRWKGLALEANLFGVLDIEFFLQHSIDGIAWDDFMHFPEMTSGDVLAMSWSATASPTSEMHIIQDAAFDLGGAGDVLNGPVGHNWRIKYIVNTDYTGATHTGNFQPYLQADGPISNPDADGYVYTISYPIPVGTAIEVFMPTPAVVDERQFIAITAGDENDTFTFAWDGDESDPVTVPAGGYALLDGGQIETALDTITGLELDVNFSITHVDDGEFTISFFGALSGIDVDEIEVTNETGAVVGTVVTSRPGGTATEDTYTGIINEYEGPDDFNFVPDDYGADWDIYANSDSACEVTILASPDNPDNTLTLVGSVVLRED